MHNKTKPPENPLILDFQEVFIYRLIYKLDPSARFGEEPTLNPLIDKSFNIKSYESYLEKCIKFFQQPQLFSFPQKDLKQTEAVLIIQ